MQPVETTSPARPSAPGRTNPSRTGDIGIANVPSITPQRSGDGASVAAPHEVPSGAHVAMSQKGKEGEKATAFNWNADAKLFTPSFGWTPQSDAGRRETPEPATRWLAGGIGWMRLEHINRWRTDVSQPLIEIHKSVQQSPGHEPVIVTRHIRRAVSPSRVEVVSSETKPVSQADPLEKLMKDYPIEMPQIDLDISRLSALSMESLEERHMEIRSIEPRVSMVMHDGYLRHREAEREGKAGPPVRTVLVYEASGEFIKRTEIRERDEGKESANPRLSTKVTMIRRERVPREFLHYFEGRFPQDRHPDEWNREIRRDADETLESEYSDNEESSDAGHPGGPPAEERTFPDAASDKAPSSESSQSGRGSPVPSTSSPRSASPDNADRGDPHPVSTDGMAGYLTQVSSASGVSASEQIAHVARNYDLSSMQIFTPNPGQLVAVSAMYEEGRLPVIFRLGLIPDKEPPEVVASVVRVVGWDRDERLVQETLPLSAFDTSTQRILTGKTKVGQSEFNRKWLVGPDPWHLKADMFAVMRQHAAHKVGRRLVLDNMLKFNGERERHIYKLSSDGRSIETKVFNRSRASPQDIARKITLTEMYTRPTEFHHPDLVALLKGEGVEKWNREVKGIAKDWEDLHDNY